MLTIRRTWIKTSSRLCVRSQSTVTSPQTTTIHILNSSIYRFGTANASSPVLRNVSWTVKEGEAWAIVGAGSGEKTTLFQTLLGRLKITPSPPSPYGLFPFLTVHGKDPHDHISIVSFAHRPQTTGEFYDYAARYGAVRDEDRLTLRENMFPETIPKRKWDWQKSEDEEVVEERGEVNMSEKELEAFERLIEKVKLKGLLDIPMIALSNGQTRRARIVKAILKKPELLLLDEPLTGVDAVTRPALLSLLHDLHRTQSPRIIMGLRTQDPIPEWITHIAVIDDGSVKAGKRDEVALPTSTNISIPSTSSTAASMEKGEVLVSMKDIGIRYGHRQVLKDINWDIRAGDRWHLAGENGSGKTTLLNVLTGEHPQSYIQRSFSLFGKPRSKIATMQLKTMIGVASPEMYNAFPRRAGVSVKEVVATGFDGSFTPKVLHDKAKETRVEEVVKALGPSSWVLSSSSSPATPSTSSHHAAAYSDEEFMQKEFITLSAGEQAVVLLMRALVSQPKVVILDEVWSGMDAGMVRAVRRFLRENMGKDQAVVVVSHWEEEVPWTKEEGVRSFRLVRGNGKEE